MPVLMLPGLKPPPKKKEIIISSTEPNNGLPMAEKLRFTP